MPRKIWTGSINFGLVTIPVGLYAATEDHTIQFHQYERGTADRIRYKRVNERTGKEVGYNDIVKGRESDGMIITVEPSELDEIAPGRSRTIDIATFVDISEIDPVFFQKTYWLAPNSKEHFRPYNLLREAMRETSQAGIATFVLRGKQYLTAVRADDDVLALNTLYFEDEIRDPRELVGEGPEQVTPSDKELQMATTIIESMSGPWEPEQYEDTYAARVEELLAEKARGGEVKAAEAPPQPTDVIDLTEALRRSVDEARKGRKPKRAEEDLSELSKAELDDRAKQLGIKGRSKMKRAELEEAVAAATQKPTGTAGRRSRRAS
ncbi:non-homologous end joining protein Ku [Saccharopolyspora phatthalungensis]|uniref:Non-homologous end joining protein Ku n=1 Tax=Saccharopolyspora phatthalungensis TaxID=664693 RepID=A0A840QD89_9PSEU|nr:Ku protein [Saccharopolyspora phatthalungensis]MBB5158366.1 DNA end-binding protein Ku [Saccharopolyspora phatthalungensis]